MDEQAMRQAAREAFLRAVSVFEARSKEELRRTVRGDDALDTLLMQAVLRDGYLESQGAAPGEVLRWFRAKTPEEQERLGRDWLRGGA